MRILLFLLAVFVAFSLFKSFENIKISNKERKVVKEFLEVIRKIGIKNERVVLAQAVHETDFFTSKIFKENKNVFGMKHNKRGYSLGVKNGHAYYRNVIDSYLDYKEWQKSVLSYYGGELSDEQYLRVLERLPFCSCRYAEDIHYIEKLQKRMLQLKEIDE